LEGLQFKASPGPPKKVQKIPSKLIAGHSHPSYNRKHKAQIGESQFRPG
jgi:hypothetical protein